MRQPSSHSLLVAGVGSLLLQLGVALPTQASTDLSTALSSGTPHLQIRIRGELVEQDNSAEDASAVTARARLGYTTQAWQGWQGQLEFESTQPFGGEAYNVPTDANKTRSVIADPDGDEINQAWLEYQGLPDTQLRVGRTRLKLDNLRFIGHAGWRQNQRNYDGYVMTNTSLPHTRIVLAQLNNSNTPVFTKQPMDTQLVNVHFDGFEPVELTAYHYRIDFDQNNADHRTSGMRANGKLMSGDIRWRWQAEFARQIEHGDATDLEVDYWQLGAGMELPLMHIAFAAEELGSDGTQGFATPLAALHPHNGWADVFLATPANGLQDLALKFSGKALGMRWALNGHKFAAARGSQDYGQEIDALLKRGFGGGLTGLLKVAIFEAASNSPYVDTRKFWLQLEYGF